MRNLIRAVAVAVVLMSASSARAEGAVGDYVKASGMKLVHGVASCLYSPLEYLVTPVAFAIHMDGDGRAPVGFVAGIPLGVFNANFRAMRGGWEILTFPFVADSSAARPFDFEPQVTGWTMYGRAHTIAPASSSTIETARASGDR